MDFFSILSMIGGLALFLFGMDYMGANLSKASGGKLEQILEKLTSNKLKGVLLGVAVTAVIQSSSATTVMVVGFVNSGIMKLTQAASIIMGANIGTTVTSWILSLSGIQSDNFIIQFLKPSSFSPIFALIGIILLMFTKKESKRNIGGIMIGFAILMTGMDTMSAAVKPLADVPEFTSILTRFSNPILGMAAGTILTAIIQSSSASVGILQALCVTGAVTYGTAIPIIMGQNIGTCVTAMLSAIGASKNAKRAAFVHLYFNIIGTVLFMVVFYSLNAFIHFDFLTDACGVAGIAVIHSCFNIAATLILLPFVNGLVWLACKTIRDDSKEDDEEASALTSELNLLDSRFLNQPALAVQHCCEVTVRMGQLAQKAIGKSLRLIKEYREEEAAKVLVLENAVDEYEDKLSEYILQISSQEISEKDSRTITLLLHSIGDIERISDHAMNVVESAQEAQSKSMKFSEHAYQELEVLSNAISEILNQALLALKDNDVEIARNVEPLEEVIDKICEKMKVHHINRLRKGSCTPEMGFVLMDITTDLERVADHCSNLAVGVLENVLAEEGRHAYLEHLKAGTDQGFIEAYQGYKDKYGI